LAPGKNDHALDEIKPKSLMQSHLFSFAFVTHTFGVYQEIIARVNVMKVSPPVFF
jgi:ABC-type dipeptide/oligopeptide/nickel transport system ATPase component